MSMRILLWSPKGSSTTFYGGTAIPSYRLYRDRDQAAVQVDLAHATALQPDHPEVFRRQHLIYPLYDRRANGCESTSAQAGGSGTASAIGRHPVYRAFETLASKAALVSRSRSWIAAHARDYDVVHGLGAHIDTFAAALKAEDMGLPVVLTTVILEELDQGSRMARLLGVHRWRLRNLKRMTAVVAISQEIQARLLDLGVAAERIVNLPFSGVDTDEFRPLTDRAEKSAHRMSLGFADRPTVLFAGTLVPRKRPGLLIPALADACKAGIDGQLILAGPEHDPAYCEQMRQEASRLGVADRVIWYGFTQKMSGLMRASTVLALPSQSEGLPGVIMEAMACGLPCIYTNISGARDLIDDGVDGRIIAADGAGLGEALGTYLGDIELSEQQGMKARAKAEAKFGNRAVFQRYFRVFDNVRSGRAPAA